MKKTVIIIPARYASTRFPGKSLAPICGKPMIQWVWEAAQRCKKLRAEVIVATDDRRIFDAVEKFGGCAMMTRRSHRSGTDRMAEVATKIRADLYVNLQGDEPLLKSGAVEEMVLEIGTADIATLAHRIDSEKEWSDPNVVKVVFNQKNEALYFSRSPMPFHRDGFQLKTGSWRHIGIYVFTAKALKQFVGWPSGSLEKLEKLEQLRALENGLKIKVIPTKFRCLGVDVPADLVEAEKALAMKL